MEREEEIVLVWLYRGGYALTRLGLSRRTGLSEPKLVGALEGLEKKGFVVTTTREYKITTAGMSAAAGILRAAEWKRADVTHGARMTKLLKSATNSAMSMGEGAAVFCQK